MQTFNQNKVFIKRPMNILSSDYYQFPEESQSNESSLIGCRRCISKLRVSWYCTQQLSTPA